MDARIIEKIRKLLAMTEERGASENEAMVAALKAQKLMAEYNLTIADIEDENAKNEIVEEGVDAGTKYKWKYRLANIIAVNFCCKVFIVGKSKVVFYGYENHAKIAKEVFSFLFNTGNKLANNYYYRCMKDGRDTIGVKNTFLNGFCDGIKEVLGQQCRALMLVTPKEVEEGFKKITSGSTPIRTTMKISRDAQAYNDGKFEGRSVANARSLETK